MGPACATAFLALHQGPKPLLLPNPWDVGIAKLLASLGLATERIEAAAVAARAAFA